MPACCNVQQITQHHLIAKDLNMGAVGDGDDDVEVAAAVTAVKTHAEVSVCD